jgi:hypothetical protein
MSVPLATIFKGDVTLEEGSDISQFGYGDLTVNRRGIMKSTENSSISNTSLGSLVVHGGASIKKTICGFENLNILYGVTRLTETRIDTTNGPVTVTGGNRVDISVGAASQFVTTGGNLSLVAQSKILSLYGGNNSSDAVDIQATHNNGGITLLSGTNAGSISMITGSGGLSGFTSQGNITFTANDGHANYIVNSNSDITPKNLSILLNSPNDSQLLISSSGINNTKQAILINTTNQNGTIEISNSNGVTNGLGLGSITQLTGSGGYTLRTNTGGSLNLTCQGASASFLVKTNEQDQDLTIGVDNITNSSLVLRSYGTHDAIKINTMSNTGWIEISQPIGSSGYVGITTGSNGFSTTTQNGGSINMNAYGSTSLYTNTTNADGQHLTISVTGNTDSKVIIDSEGTGSEAILLQTNNSGGIYLNSDGSLQLESSDDIRIGTNNLGVPIYIGTNTSTTIVNGDLIVQGETTTVNTNVLTVEDNIITVNSSPAGSSDGGMAIKRWQPANNTGAGDVVNDTPELSGTVGMSGNSSTSINLGPSASNTTGYYNGWWVKITAGTGAPQVRKIKSYDGNTHIAIIYETIDQTTILKNPTPIEGLDFITIPDNTSSYSLYPCHYVMSIWDESNDEFALVCSTSNTAEDGGEWNPNVSHYSNLHLNNLNASAIFASTINGSMADITTTVTLTDATNDPVTVVDFPYDYGIYLVYVKPLTNTTRSHGIFMIGRVNVYTVPGTIVRIISVKGAQNDQLDIQWRMGEKPELMYRQHPIDISGTTAFKIKIVSL